MRGKCDMGLLFSYSAFRIIRWEPVLKRDGSWVYHYVMSAYRHPDQVPVNTTWNAFRYDLLCRFPSCFRSVAGGSMARFHCDKQYGQVPLRTSLFPRLVAEILCTRRTILPGL